MHFNRGEKVGLEREGETGSLKGKDPRISEKETEWLVQNAEKVDEEEISNRWEVIRLK